MNVKQMRRAGLQFLAATSMIALLAGCGISPSSLSANNSTNQTTASTNNNISGVTSKTAAITAQTAAGTKATTSSTAASSTSTTASNALSDFSSAVRDVSQKVRPAVVQITNQQVQLDQYNQTSYSVPTGVGSGVIYDNQGHILTNNHVIEGAQELLVSLPDGRSFTAKLIGADPQTDLAVVQISGSNLPVAQLGDSSQLQVGDWVVAIGNALALPGGPTVTAGVVSALNRTVQEPGSTLSNGQQSSNGPFLFDVVQTSAPINPGNSGGPLVNLNGEVIGINTLVAGDSGNGVSAQGIGFAISINAAKPIADQLVASGHVTHTYLGVRYLALNPSIAAQLGISTQKNGLVVMTVVQGSPAAQAGLQRLDVITSVNGTDITDESTLAQAISTNKPGDKISLTILRGSQQKTVSVTLGELTSQ